MNHSLIYFRTLCDAKVISITEAPECKEKIEAVPDSFSTDQDILAPAQSLLSELQCQKSDLALTSFADIIIFSPERTDMILSIFRTYGFTISEHWK